MDKHPGRKYIGVVFERGMTLPRGKGAARRRRLGFVGRRRDMGTLATGAVVEGEGLEGIEEEEVVGGLQDIRDGERNIVKSMPLPPPPAFTITKEEESPKPKKGYMYRPTNYEIGRAIEKHPQELSSATRREEGGAAEQQQRQLRVRNKFHAWHLRKLLWRKESERRSNIKKGRGKKKKRQMG